MPDNGWIEWRRHVLIELESNKEDHEKIMDALSEMRKDVAVLQVRAGLWGFAAGLIPTIGAAVIMIVMAVT